MMFNETLTEPRSYADFIEKLRGKLVYTYAGGVPMLPPKEGREKNYFHITLIYKDKDKINEDIEITLQIQQASLYLVAFKGTNGQWYAFKDQMSIAPPNSKKLKAFTSEYPKDDSMVKTKVGRQSLKDAITGLAKYHETEKETQTIHSFLITLSVMFPEAIRFKRVAEFVNPYMLKGEPENEIGIAINDLIHKWDAISEEMRRHDQLIGGNFDFSRFPKANITTMDQAVSTVGILLYQKVPPIPKQTKGPDKKK